jgi:adenosylcobinamide-GDP ribazoletransferase
MSAAELLFAAVAGIAPLVASLIFIQSFMQKDAIAVALASLAIVWLTRWGMGRYFFHKIDGYTGDCLGAVQQVTETVFYLTLSAFMA